MSSNNENRHPVAAVRKSRLGLQLRPSNKIPTATVNENARSRPPRAPLGVIADATNVQKQDKMGLNQLEKLGKSFPLAAVHHSRTLAAVAPPPPLLKSAFTVHIDDDAKADENKENGVCSKIVPIQACVTKIRSPAGAIRQPLLTLEITRDYLKESPMVLDPSSTDSSSSLDEDQQSTSQSTKSSTCSDLCTDMLLLPYAQETYSYLREMEVRCHAKAMYMRKQPDITNGMRSILVDWLVEVATEYNLHQETLHLTISYVDRFLSCMSVLRAKLQLVGTASMFIAAKFEEIHPPEVEEFVNITDNTYTKRQVIRMEHVILKVLAFDLAVPTSFYFVQRFCHTAETDDQTYFLALYLSELTLLEADPYLQFFPSIIAGSAVCLARHTQDLEAWPQSLCSFSGYKMEHFKECVHFLFRTFCNAQNYPQQAIRLKYNSSQYMEASSILPPATQPI